MAGQQSRPGGRSQAANDAENRVPGTSDSPQHRLAWLHGLASVDGLPRGVLGLCVDVSAIANGRGPFAVHPENLAWASGYSEATVRLDLLLLCRNGWLELVSRRRSDDWRIVRWTNNGPVGRWEPRPATYRLTMGSTEWVGRRRKATP